MNNNQKFFQNVNNNLNYIKLAFEQNLFHLIKDKFNLIINKERNKVKNPGNFKQIGLLDDGLLFDNLGNFPLSWAAMNGHENLVRMLVEEYDFPLDFQNLEGNTALGTAVIGGYDDIVEYLLKKGANPNISNVKKESPLHIAACFGYWEICRLLISYGAWIDAEDEAGDTPLHWGVREEHIEVIELLIMKGANVEHLNEDEESPKDLAREVNREIYEYFESRAGFNTDVCDLKDSVPESPPLSPNVDKFESLPFVYSSLQPEFYLKPAGEDME